MVSPYIVVLQVVGIISVLSSCSVILTLFFKGMRQKLFMRIIAFISISDFFANVIYVFPSRPKSDSPLCTLEAFTNIYFYPAGWMWTTSLMLLLYSLAMKGKLPYSSKVLHALCWGVPLLLALINFVIGPSKSRSSDYVFDICILGGDSLDIFIYHSISYYGLFLVCVVSMFVMYLKIARTDKLEINSKFPAWKAAKDTLQLYPLALLLCWIPHLVSVFAVDYARFTGLNEFFFAADILKIAHGTVTAIIFFSKSGEARSKWKRLFLRTANSFRALFGMKQIDLIQSKVVDFSVEYDEPTGNDSLIRNSFVDDYKVDINAVQVDGTIISITTRNSLYDNREEESYVEIC